MELHNFLIVLLLLLVLLLSIVQAEHRYHLGQSTFNNRTIMIMNNEGLTGSYVGYHSNTTAQIKGANIQYSLWFTNTTEEVFTLSLVAHNDPKAPDLRELSSANGWVPKSQTVEGRIIWAANPNKPVGREATFNVSQNGNLELRDVNGTLVWESNTGDKNATDFHLTDSGTLELRDSKQNGKVVWQSSGSPTDTLMQNQVLKFDISKSDISLKSSVNYNSTCQGNCSLLLNRDAGVSLVYTSTEKQIYWTWNGTKGNYSGLTLCDNETDLSLQLQSSQTSQQCCAGSHGTWAVAKTSNATQVNETFLKLEPDGDVSVYAWELTNWKKIYSLFENESCKLPMKCGAYGLCEEGTCKGCIEHTIKDENGTCQVIENMASRGQTTLVKLDGAYEYFATNYNGKIMDSQKACMNSCNYSCNAAFYRDIGNGRGYCFVTSNVGTLIHHVNNTAGAVAFLRVPKSIKRSSMKLMVLASVSTALLAVFITGITVCQILRKLKTPVHLDSDIDEEDSMLENSIRSVLPTRFLYKDVEEFTDGFSHELGAGSFGTVYKGTLANGTEVAVKKLDKSHRNHKEFLAEIASLARNRHWSLVQLLGYSMKRSCWLLIYEYMPNGSLASWLFNEEKKQELNWNIRFNIALGTAKGLAYLHEECAEKIMHLDFKPPNILLDSVFNAKIGDFGLSKLVERDQSLVVTMMRGTPGYLAPDWLTEGAITEKVDVYSFGVVLLELVTGQTSRNLLPSRDSLRALVLKLQEQEQEQGEMTRTVLELVDHSLHNAYNYVNVEQMNRALRVGVLCIQDEPGQRPSMSKVVQMLEGTHPIAKLCFPERSWGALSSTSVSDDASTSVFTSSGGALIFLLNFTL